MPIIQYAAPGLRTASQFQLPEEEQRDMLRGLLGVGTSAVSGIGSILDLPASSLRDLAVGQNPFDQWLSPLDPTKRVEGRDVLRQYGFVGPQNTWGNWGAGLAAEIAFDPLTYATFGASALGKAGRAARMATGGGGDILRAAQKQATKRLGYKPGQLGPREFRVAGTGEDILAGARSVDEFAKGKRLSGAQTAQEALEMESARQLGWTGHTMRFDAAGDPMMDAFRALQQQSGGQVGSLFRWAGMPVGRGRAAQGIARTLDAPGRALGGFRGPGAVAAKEATRATRELDKQAEAVIRGSTFRLSRDVKKAREFVPSLTDQEVRTMGENFDRILDSVTDLANRGAPPEVAAQVGRSLGEVKQLGNDIQRMAEITGKNPGNLIDEALEAAGLGVDWMARGSELAKMLWTKTGGRYVGSGQQATRNAALKGFARGTEGVNQFFVDERLQPFFNAIQEAMEKEKILPGTPLVGRMAGTSEYRAAVKEAANEIEKLYGPGTLSAEEMARATARVGPEAAGVGPARATDPERVGETIQRFFMEEGKDAPTDRYEQLAAMAAEIPADHRAAGLFTNDPAVDMANGLIRQVYLQNQYHSSHRILTDNVADIRNGDWQGETMKLGDALQAKTTPTRARDIRGLEVDKPTAALRSIANDLGMDPENLQAVAELPVSRELVDALSRNLAPQLPREPNKWVRAYDAFNSFFKAVNTTAVSLPPFSAFAARNWYAGQFHNFIHGVWSLRDHNDAGKFIKQGWDSLSGTSEWKGLRDEWVRRGNDVKNFTDNDANELLQEMVFAHDLYGPGMDYVQPGLTPADMMQETAPVTPVSMEGPGTRPTTFGQIYRQALPRFLGGTTEQGYRLNPLTGNIANIRGTQSLPGTARELFGGGPAPVVREETMNPLIRAGENVNTMVEGYNRLSPFFNQLRKGIDPQFAADKVKALQVDYSWRNFSDFERRYMTRAFPFYKWTSRMLPLTLKTIIERPGGIQAQMVRAQIRAGEADEYLPESVRRGLAIPLTDNTYVSQFDMPWEGAWGPLQMGRGPGIGKFLGGTVQNTLAGLAGMTAPPIRLGIEEATGKQLFSGRDLEKLDGAVSRILNNVGDIIEEVSGRDIFPELQSRGILRTAENFLASMIGSPLAKLRTVTDTREGLTPFGTIKKLANIATGARIQTVDDLQRSYGARDELRQIMRGMRGYREFPVGYTREGEEVDPALPGMIALERALGRTR